MKYLLLLLFVFKGLLLFGQHWVIRGKLEKPDGKPYSFLEVAILEEKDSIYDTTDELGRFKIILNREFDPHKSVTLTLNRQEGPYSFSSDPDSIITTHVVPGGIERQKIVILKVYGRPALSTTEKIPDRYFDLYNIEYTILLFSLKNKKMTEVEVESLTRKIGLSRHRVSYYRHDELSNTFYRYTFGRFKNLKDAENLLKYLKENKSDQLDKDARIVNLLYDKPPQTYYRVQVRSSTKKMDDTEKKKIEKRAKMEILEIKDIGVSYPKFDYYLHLKFSNKNDAERIQKEVVKSGIKGAYVVKIEMKENKIVKNIPIQSKKTKFTKSR